VNTKALVVKDNRLVEASYTLSLVEQRIVLMAIAWSRQNDLELSCDTWVELQACEYADMYKITLDAAYKQLSNACESLQERKIKIMGVDRLTRAPAVYKSKWVTDAIYVQDVGVVRLKFSEMLVPYVSDLNTHFTSYAIGSVSSLSTGYAIRMYELLAQYKTIGSRKILIGDLKDYLECDTPAYDRLDNFRRRVIDPALEQINDCTDLTCTYETNKLGKRVVGFDFKIQIKQQNMKPLRTVKSNASSNKLLPAQGLSISERAMLRDLQAKHPDLTEKKVIQMAKTQNKDVFMILYEIGKTGVV
jgi:plasmid replication initiation protein